MFTLRPVAFLILAYPSNVHASVRRRARQAVGHPDTLTQDAHVGQQENTATLDPEALVGSVRFGDPLAEPSQLVKTDPPSTSAVGPQAAMSGLRAPTR